MSEKAEKKPDAAPPPAKGGAEEKKKEGGHDEGGGKKGGLMTKMPVLLGIVMILEAVVLFAGFKFLGAGAKPAAGAELSVPTTESSEGGKSEGGEGGEKGASVDKKKTVVVKVTEFKAPNKKSGTSFLYDLKICAITKGEYEKRVEESITDQEPLIQDRIRTIIAQSDPEKLSGGSEPGLETLRRQIKYQLDEIIGEGMIDEVLVPRCIPFRTDY
jgi:flagellar basal body-associated protein FliL